jgi:hypothetical protein
MLPKNWTPSQVITFDAYRAKSILEFNKLTHDVVSIVDDQLGNHFKI